MATLRRIVLATLAAALAGTAAEAKELGHAKSWKAFEDGAGPARVCFVYASPQKSVGKYTRRGAVSIQVAHRPAEKIRDEVSITAGYTYKKNSRVAIDIDGAKFRMFTDGGYAWLDNAKADGNFVRALIKGRRMVVRGRSSRNTRTTDIYDLAGFTAAYRLASRACKVSVR